MTHEEHEGKWELVTEDRGGDTGAGTGLHNPHLEPFKSVLNIATGRGTEESNTFQILFLIL